MSFRLTMLEEGPEQGRELVFDQEQVTIGSSPDCSVRVESAAVGRNHLLIRRHGLHYVLSSPQAAGFTVNGVPAAEVPCSLRHNDVIDPGDFPIRFQFVPVKAKRSWKTSFISKFALFLLIMIVVFELAVMLWLPRKLNEKLAWEKESALQDVIKLEDETRAMSKSFSTICEIERWRQAVLVACLDDIARYLRKYRHRMSRRQIRDLRGDLMEFQPIIDNWNPRRKGYSQDVEFDARGYLDALRDDIAVKLGVPPSKLERQEEEAEDGKTGGKKTDDGPTGDGPRDLKHDSGQAERETS